MYSQREREHEGEARRRIYAIGHRNTTGERTPPTGDPHRGGDPAEDPPPEGRATQGTHTEHTDIFGLTLDHLKVPSGEPIETFIRYICTMMAAHRCHGNSQLCRLRTNTATISFFFSAVEPDSLIAILRQ